MDDFGPWNYRGRGLAGWQFKLFKFRTMTSTRRSGCRRSPLKLHPDSATFKTVKDPQARGAY